MVIGGIKGLFLIAILAVLSSGGGCPGPGGHGRHYALIYRAAFVLDAGNGLHLFYSNNYANKAWHLEKKPGGWKRELLEPVGDPDYQALLKKEGPWPRFFYAGLEGKTLCARVEYSNIDVGSASYHICQEADMSWIFTRKNVFYSVIFMNNDEALQMMRNENYDTFSIINRETGVKRVSLPPVYMKWFPPPDPSEGLQQHLAARSIYPVYDKGRWNGTDFIYYIPLQRIIISGDSMITERAVCYLLSYQGNSWKTEKILELPYEGGARSSDNHKDYLISTLIFWKDRIINALGTDFFLEKDATTGKLITEPIPPSYLALFERLEHSTRRFYGGSTGIEHFHGNPPGFISLPNLVDQGGKVHVLVAEGEDFKRDIYYEVYNPDAIDPTVPEVREFIEHQE